MAYEGSSTQKLKSSTPDSLSQPVTIVMEQYHVQLKREVGLVGATSLVVGMIIGSGIFVSPKGVLQATGSVGLSLLVWVLAGIIQLGASLCYAELGAMVTKAGGAYTYIAMGVGNPLAFAFVIQTVLVLSPCVLIILTLTFAKYTISMLPTCGSPAFLEKFIAATAIITLAIVNSYSSRLTARVAIVTTFGKVAALCIIIIGGVVVMAQGTTYELGSRFAGTSRDPTSLALALYSAGFSYGGGESLNVLVEEIKNPGKNLPRAAIYGTVTVIVVYVLTNLAYLAVMTRSELLAADAVAVVFGDRVLGPAAKIIPVAVMISTLGAANNLIFSQSRLVYVAARDRNIPDFLSYIQINQLTPLCAMILMVCLSLIFLIHADIGTLMNHLGFLSSFYQCCILVSFFRFRLRTMKDVDRPIKIPMVIPAAVFLVNLYMFIAPIAISPQLQYVYVAIGVFGIAAVLYVPFIHYRISLPFYDSLVTVIQLTCHVCPPTKDIK